ncbi:hypothetical protein PENSPDRAFT_319303 [Peniophora sp. CONT]|nr:hypothetical protein PENSPDRAFT_319303 [Peniophora sp. CONT]
MFLSLTGLQAPLYVLLAHPHDVDCAHILLIHIDDAVTFFLLSAAASLLPLNPTAPEPKYGPQFQLRAWLPTATYPSGAVSGPEAEDGLSAGRRARKCDLHVVMTVTPSRHRDRWSIRLTSCGTRISVSHPSNRPQTNFANFICFCAPFQ